MEMPDLVQWDTPWIADICLFAVYSHSGERALVAPFLIKITNTNMRVLPIRLCLKPNYLSKPHLQKTITLGIRASTHKFLEDLIQSIAVYDSDSFRMWFSCIADNITVFDSFFLNFRENISKMLNVILTWTDNFYLIALLPNYSFAYNLFPFNITCRIIPSILTIYPKFQS